DTLIRFFRALIQRPIAVFMLVLALLGAAAIAALRIPIEMLPSNLASTTIFVQVPWAGANPNEVETRVVRPLEGELRTLSGVKETLAVASSGSGYVVLSYPGDTDMDQAQAEVADRVERVRPLLPSDADRVTVRRFQSSDLPIMWIGVAYEEDTFERSQNLIGNVLAPRLEAVEGVAAVNASGVLPQSVRIFLDEDKIVANRVDISSLVARLQADNQSAPVGDLDDAGSRYIVRVDSRFQSLQDIEEFPVQPGLTLADVGRVALVRSAPESYFKVNGEFAVGMSVQKETSANTFEVCRELATVIKEKVPLDPAYGGMEFSIFWNQGENVQSALESLVRDAILGGLIASMVLMLFLRRLRYTLLIAASIPFSVLITLAFLYFAGETFNILTMTGITVSIGMLVDNSVVIVESIFARRERGESLREACANGPSEVMLAVITATLTTVVVFVPLIFMGEDQNARVLTGAVGVPLCVSLVAALLLAIVIVPVVCYRLGGHAEEGQPTPPFRRVFTPVRNTLDLTLRPFVRLVRIFDRASPLAFVRKFLPKLVNWSLDHPLRASSLAILVFFSGQVADYGGQVSNDLSMGNQLEARFRIRGAANLGEAHDQILKMEEALTDPQLLEDIGSPDLGVQFDRDGGKINIWHEKRPTPNEERQVLETLQGRLPELATIEYRFGEEFNERATEDQKGWTRIQLEGPDSRTLMEVLEEVRKKAESSGLFESVSEAAETSREILVRLDRDRMSQVGLNSQTMVGNIEWNLRGFMVSRFQMPNEDVPIILEYDRQDNPDRRDLTDMSIWTGLASVPLSTFASFEPGRGPAAISRRDGRTVASLGLKTNTEDLKEAARQARQFMSEIELPEGYHWTPVGGLADFNEGLQDIQRALMLSIALVFLLMGLLFNSLILPFSVLVSVPFAWVGFQWAFRLSGVPIDLLAWVGMIVLAGVVVNNGIVLVDRILQLETRGHGRREAILGGVRDRLRPVLMTAFTTICGLLPIAMSEGGSGGFSFRGLAIGVSGGLAISTLCTLWTVPLVYAQMRRAADWSRAWFQMRKPAAEASAEV
ncbi:MAG: efflux RND transporter permease subunit, partial [Planctomycetes bacterium]|nr:efflux RND transporter permease subunit [Planctomycetota bacterium]